MLIFILFTPASVEGCKLLFAADWRQIYTADWWGDARQRRSLSEHVSARCWHKVFLCFILSPHSVPDWLGLDWCSYRKKKNNPPPQTWECLIFSATVETAPVATKKNWHFYSDLTLGTFPHPKISLLLGITGHHQSASNRKYVAVNELRQMKDGGSLKKLAWPYLYGRKVLITICLFHLHPSLSAMI